MQSNNCCDLTSVCSSASISDEALCEIDIEDVNSGAKYSIEHKFIFEPNPDRGQRKYFKIPGLNYTCQLYFFDLGIGTMLSCELDEVGFINTNQRYLSDGIAMIYSAVK